MEKNTTMRKKKENLEIIRETFLELNLNFLNKGSSLETLKFVVRDGRVKNGTKKVAGQLPKRIIIGILLSMLLGALVEMGILGKMKKYFLERRCLVGNNYLVWELTRPVSSCDFCRDVDAALVLPNVTRSQFQGNAYSSRPIIVKSAASHWQASKIFNITFFRSIYENFEDAYNSIDEECQFLPFKSDLQNLRDVLEMSDKRAAKHPGEESWYVGWKNCHPEILKILNTFYDPPHFLPNDAEVPATNYIFLGYDEGAVMHLDYIPRLMWQGQIIGRKTWTVAPTPECEHVCKTFSFSVDTGDVVLLDTRIWYHGTRVEDGLLSLTITSEYG
ncbi:uncharacterized protein [Venturia canescens]|uniref:uncharacterized protein n=1 Tax=Venturia canescens TaxID=32260 RepID=UPI001C9BE181|nr:uncharacterized protein LOC122415831 [Venturia canescens]